MSNRNAVIIKKVKKVTGAGHHGGAWKVAYADFVTAMMAFFLLLWLLSMTSDEKRARISEHFQHFSLYSESGSSFMSGSDDDIFKSTTAGNEKVLTEMEGDDEAAKDIEESLNKSIANQLGDLEEQVTVEKVKDGIRIHLTDNEGSTMFERGSNKMTPKAKAVLRVIGENIKSLKNKVSIEGHTDALPFAGANYSNWELSTERASAARRELEANGLDPKRLVSVAGFADTDPLIEDDPNDSRNRRISIILKFPKKKQNRKVLEKKSKSPEEKVSKELLNLIDKSTITARGNNEKEAINVNDAPVKNNNQPSSSPPSPVENKAEIAPANNNFSPVFGKEEWKANIVIPESMSHNDQIDPASQKDAFSPVFDKEQWNPNIAIPESMSHNDQTDPASQKDDITPVIDKKGNISEELMNLIDKSAITARGNNDSDTINMIIDVPVENNNQPSSSPPSPVEKESETAPSNNQFSPVFGKEEWKANIAIPESMSPEDQIDPGSQKDDFSPVFGKEGWKPNTAIPESISQKDEIDPTSQKDEFAPLIDKKGNISEEIMNLIDKSTITARGNNERDAINIIIDVPEENNNQTSSSPPAPVEKDPSDSATKEDEFSPVIDKSGWKPIF
jgi:chemotaxis protein MotB